MLVTRRRARRHAVIHIVIAAALIAVILPLALRVSAAQPPAIAEFAPQALQQITNAPNSQALGAQGGLPPTPTPSPTPSPSAAAAQPTPPPIERGRVRACVGSPARQTEDPQSPPCVPYFDGNNGGATAPGVTANTITVAAYGGDPRLATDMQQYFNTRFEFYGRQLSLVAGPSPAGTCAGRQSDADTVAHEIQAFGSTDANGDGETCYEDELARDHVINVGANALRTQAQLAAGAPYSWQYPMALDDQLTNLGKWACDRLAGSKAVHAGAEDPITQAKTRAFGALVETGITSHTPDMAPLNAELQRCGTGLVDVEHIASDLYPQDHETAILHLKNAGATTIFCFCVVFLEANDPEAAQSQNYYPEWIMSTYGANDTNVIIHDMWPQETGEILGTTFTPMQVPYADLPMVQAVHQVDPSYAFTNSLYVNGADMILYRSLLLLASGIQMAGPDLTAQNFQAGLWKTTFPNPDTPIMAGHVGFPPGSHSMTIDGGEIWYNPNAPSPYPDEGAGTYCYVGGGARQTYNTWPRGGDPFYPANGSCP